MSATLKFGGAGKWAAKAGSVLAYNDENNNFKPLPFTFTRASSATRVNESGLIESVASGVPRIDFLNNADGHLLLEPSRTNLVPRSEDLDTGWSKLNVTIANNSTISPDGNTSAGLVTVTSTSGTHADYDTLSASTTPSVAHYISCFVKKSTTRYIRLNEGFSGATLNFDLDNGTIVSLSGGATNSILQDFGNGWYRIGFQFTSNATGDIQFALYLNDNSNTSSYAGAGEAVYLWGAQLEAGSYATSYIPTSGSSVTRVADAAYNAGNTQVFNSSEGVLYAEIEALSDDSTSRYISISNGTTTNRIIVGYDAASDIIRAIINSGSITNQATFSISENILQYNKIALKYKLNDVSFWINGVNVGVDTSAVMPTGLNELAFDSGAGASNLYGKVKNIQVYNQALTDSQLAALTS